MSSRTRTLLLAGCFFVAGLFAPPPLVRLGASHPAPGRTDPGITARAADGGTAGTPRELALSVQAGLACARR